MRKLKTSHVWAFICLQIIGTYIIGLNWGVFTKNSALGFMGGIAIWTVFILSTLFDFVEVNEKEKASINKD